MYAKLSLLVLRASMPRRRLGKSQITMKLKRRDTTACETGHPERTPNKKQKKQAAAASQCIHSRLKGRPRRALI